MASYKKIAAGLHTLLLSERKKRYKISQAVNLEVWRSEEGGGGYREGQMPPIRGG
jgi:hypothetical protein